jgi:predicted transcriptional regulator YdeE
MLLSGIGHVRTNDFSDSLMMDKISGLWRDCAEAAAKERADGRSFYAVYHDYDSDYRGDYTLSLCRESDHGGDFDTDALTYQSFPVPIGDDGVVTAWKKIWDAERRGVLRRSYSVDFERYRPDGTVSIQIAV